MKRMLATMAVVAMLIAPSAGWAAKKAKPAGVVTSVQGKVEYYRVDSKGGSKRLKIGQQVYAGDRVKTGNNGRAVMVLSDGTQLKVNYQTDLTLRSKNSKGKESARGIASVKLAIGRLWAKVTKKSSRFEFITPSAVAAVKGTTPEFDVDEEENTDIKLWEGEMDVTNEHGSTNMNGGEQLTVNKGEAPGQTKKLEGESDFDDVGGSTGAEVEIEAVDSEGQTRVLRLNYEKK